MFSCWIEAAAKGRHGGPVRAGMWSAVVLGTHPIEDDQDVWLEISADDVELGPIPAYWIENKGVNSLWHVPIPPQAVGARLHYRSAARRGGGETVYSPYQDTMVRPNLPDRTESAEIVATSPEGLVGNRMMTAKVDARGSTYDVYFPTVGLHSDVRPGEGDLPQSRSHFRAIVGGLAVGRRLDWFTERLSWESFQHYQGATNLLVTELTWRSGPIRVWTTDFVAMGDSLPRTAGGTESPGQYLKRFRINNEGTEPRRAMFGVYVQAEINGGIGEPGLSWHDGDRTLLAINRGHGHANRKLARDATVEFAMALDDRGEVYCEPTGPNEAILLRWLDLPAGESVTVDLLVSGAFTGWRGDPGTFEHWLRPALAWFRAADLDQIEQTTAQAWDDFVEPLPTLNFPEPAYAVALRRSALAIALHADATWGAIASGFDRGLSAYCWPRDAVWAGGAMERLGHPEIGRGVFQWLAKVRGQGKPYAYWFQKYTIDGGPEWETPAVDQTAMIPWGLERHYRRTGDLDFVAASWPMIEQAARVCGGDSGHPGLHWIEELNLVSSAGIGNLRFGAFLYSNACRRGRPERGGPARRGPWRSPDPADRWEALANGSGRTASWRRPRRPTRTAPGLVDAESGRFLEARRLSTLRGLWTETARVPGRSLGRGWTSACSARPSRSASCPPPIPGSAPPPRRSSASEASPVPRTSSSRRALDPSPADPKFAPRELRQRDVSSLATLWMARYLIALGRETGQVGHWDRAAAMLDAILDRLFPLGLTSAPRRRARTARGGRPAPPRAPGACTRC